MNWSSAIWAIASIVSVASDAIGIWTSVSQERRDRYRQRAAELDAEKAKRREDDEAEFDRFLAWRRKGE